MHHPIQRREFLQTTFLTAISGTLLSAEDRQDRQRPPCILLRSSWQVVNIGDIAHTPGVLALLEKYLPECEVILWASNDLSEEVIAMDHRRFPKLQIVKGTIGSGGQASNAALGQAVAKADFLLHGSGPSLVAARDVAAWVEQTGKPFGVYGITYGSFFDADRTELMSRAQFLYFRDSISLKFAKEQGIDCPIMEFAPDGAFACDLRDDDRAEAFLQANGLQPGKFVCCLSRLRFTPYWTIPEKKRAIDPERHKRNEEMKEHDHRALRETIVAIIRETDHKVLLCPEDMTQMAVGKEMFYDQLPPDVQQRVVWREKYWLTDEALSTYVRSAGLFGSEMHSPIMAIGNGIPAIVCRFAEQTSKGEMWRDIGLGDWLFDLDNPEDHPRIQPTVLDMITQPDHSAAKVAQARERVEQRQRETLTELRRHLS